MFKFVPIFAFSLLLFGHSFALSATKLSSSDSEFSAGENEDGGGDQRQQADDLSDNRTFLRIDPSNSMMSSPRGNFFGTNNDDNAGMNKVICYDKRLASFIKTGIDNYSHNMGQLSSYLMDQILRARYSGYWFVHAAMIGGQTQGVQWQSQTNGDIFSPTSRHGCYYHNTLTYVIILRY